MLHKCTYDGCELHFARPNLLNLHLASHSGYVERLFECEFDGCSKSYTRAQHLARHVKVNHTTRKKPAATNVCSDKECSKEFGSKQALDKHVISCHSGDKPYKCQEAGCGESFRKRHQLKAHGFEHKGCLPFQCHHENCKKQFKQMSHLKQHLKVHKGYTCDVADCGLIFDTWSHLRKHKSKQHQVKKAFPCDRCGYVASQNFFLARHMKVHRKRDDQLKAKLLAEQSPCNLDLCTKSCEPRSESNPCLNSKTSVDNESQCESISSLSNVSLSDFDEMESNICENVFKESHGSAGEEIKPRGETVLNKPSTTTDECVPGVETEFTKNQNDLETDHGRAWDEKAPTGQTVIKTSTTLVKCVPGLEIPYFKRHRKYVYH